MSSDQYCPRTPGIGQVKARSVQDRQREISAVIEKRFISRLSREIMPEVAEAYLRSPLGPHDDRTARVARAFGRLPLADKEVVVPLTPDGPYAIGRIATGEPGGLTEDPEHYESYEDAFRAIFKSRWDRIK
ncbi:MULTISPECIES: hypothetical protein [unclassified Sphingobium]|uniref:hypothetical protein n=1 Tax=unclassified Sphingobium TaxID=2611147 RepID=UPI0011A6CBBE|nr:MULTISPECIES: hypothetical protein [unclassified Sphingobium]